MDLSSKLEGGGGGGGGGGVLYLIALGCIKDSAESSLLSIVSGRKCVFSTVDNN